MHRFATGLAAALLVATGSVTLAKDAPRHLTRAELLDRIRGGWAGQMIGVSYGAPTEFRFNGRINEEPIAWSPERVENAIDQDDLYVEMTFAKVMDDLGLDAPIEAFGRAFRDSKYELWHANAGARRALGRGLQPPWTGHPLYNPHANDIDFQIEADFIGIMCPGLPRLSNQFCDRVGRVMNYGDGVYGGMFVCGMYSAAFFETDPRRVVEAGLACIPAKSQYALLVRDLLQWSAAEPTDWRKVWHQVQDKWDRNDPCPDGVNEPFNIDAKLNGAYIAFGLLYGGGDFLRTMEISTRCGQDSDCNPSSAAGVLGVMLGFDKIPDACKGGIAKLADRKFAFTDYSFNDIVASSEKRTLALIQKAGGSVTTTEVTIPAQSPKAPRLEQWNPGIGDRRVPLNDAAWTWQGGWQTNEAGRTSSSTGDDVTLKFEGVGVAIMGTPDQAGGRADVFLDGRRVAVADAYIVERTHETCLWHTYGLKSGKHALRIVLRPDRDGRSKANRVTISGAVLYRAP